MATLEKPKTTKKSVPSKLKLKPETQEKDDGRCCSSSQYSESKITCELEKHESDDTEAIVETNVVTKYETDDVSQSNSNCDTKRDITVKNEISATAPKLVVKKPVMNYPMLPKFETTKLVRPTKKKVEQIIKPFVESQLMALYTNPELEVAKNFTNAFIESELSGMFSKKHPLYELILNYLFSKEKLIENHLKLNKLKNEYKASQNEMWVISNATVLHSSECQDGVNVKATHEYTIAKFQRPLMDSLLKMQKKIQFLINESHTLYSYNTTVLKIKINQFITNIIVLVECLTHLDRNGSATLLEKALNPEAQYYVKELRLCISVLFTFQRQIYKDKEFIMECRVWLTNMVAVLLRIADWRDHMYLLNQVLRCPAGIGSWACSYIQIPCPLQSSVSPFSDRYVNHFIAILSIILCPILKRDTFLEQFQLAKNGPQDTVSENLWILVDSDGEEDNENPGISSLKENDLVALINQLPIDQLFRNIMLIIRKDNKDIYNPEVVTEHHILRLFAFGTVLVRLLNEGIQTYSNPRYHQFVKRLCRLMRQTLQYASDMWEIFKNENRVKDSEILIRLQIEFDAFFLCVCTLLFSAQKFGAWQFLAVVPFHMVSIQVLWRLFCLLHTAEKSDEFFSDITTFCNFEKILLDQTNQQKFEDRLYIMSTEESYYLLNIFANMIMSRSVENFDFIQFATIDLLQIGFYGAATQDNCSKCAAILLANISNRYPYLISNILTSVKENMDNIGQLSKYLFSKLPLKLWRPCNNDIDVITNWLLQHQLTSTEHSLARLVLLRLNWGFEDVDTLCLPHSLHCRIALLVAETIEKLAPDMGSTLLDGIRQAVQSTPEQVLLKWSWQMVFRLRLHSSDMMKKDFKNIPDVNQFDVIQRGLREQRPVAIYLSIIMTSIGHLVPMICSHGLTQLQVLLSLYKYDAVLIGLHNIIPLFEDCIEMLLISASFQHILISLLSADRTYMKMAKSLITADFPGVILKQFASMIESHIHGPNWMNMISFWVQALVSLPNWNKDDGILYLLNIICRTGFFNSTTYGKIVEIFKELLEKYKKQSNSGLLSWISLSSSSGVSLLSGGTQPSCPWLSYIVLSIEHECNELKTGIWKELLNQLHTSVGKTSIDNSLKKAANIVKISSFSSGSLCIYRWAQQALDTPLNHPILPLLWERFFMLYLTRISISSGVGDCGSVGNKFFDGIINMNFCKKLKKRLQESVEYLKGKLEVFNNMTFEDEITETVHLNKKFLERSLRIFKAFILWLEEPMLQEPSLHLSSLPLQYEAIYIAKIFLNETAPWMEFINFEVIHDEHKVAMMEWDNLCYRNVGTHFKPSQAMGGGEVKDPVERIVRRLSSYDKPQSPPPLKLQSLIPALTIPTPGHVAEILQPYVSKLVRATDAYNGQKSEHTAIECQYNEYLPQLYIMVPTKVTKKKTCRSVCSGSATIVLSFRESRINESIKYQLQTNRTTLDTLLTRSLQPVSNQLCMDCVSLESLISILEKQLHESKTVNEQKNTHSIAVEIFYFLLNKYNDELKGYPPARQVFHDCMEKLGQIFIMDHEQETIKLCIKILDVPKNYDLLLPHFSATNMSTETILNMYNRICSNIHRDENILLQLLSQFDIYKWLCEKTPRLSERSHFINLLFKSLTILGFQPSQEKTALHEIFRRHLLYVFYHNFPEHYGEVLNLMLRYIGTQNLSVDVFLELLRALCAPVYISSWDSMRASLKIIAVGQKMLKYNELKQTTILLSKHFAKERNLQMNGLYAKYNEYIEPLELLFGIIFHCLTVETVNLYCGLLADQISDGLFKIIQDLFLPWIMYFDMNHTLSFQANLAYRETKMTPWTELDISSAQRIYNMFIKCIMFILETLPACTNMYIMVWNFYLTHYPNKTSTKYVLNVVHAALKSLNWSQFSPSLADVESMLKIIEEFLPECHNFLGHIFCEINWTDWFNKLSDVTSCTKANHCLLHLIVKLSKEPNVRQNTNSLKIIEKMSEISWIFLDINSLEHICFWYIQSYEPKVILGSEDVKPIDHSVLRFLRIVSCIDENPDMNAVKDIAKRRMCFYKTFSKMMTHCASKHKTLVSSLPQTFQTVLKNELSHFEHIINNLSKQPNLECDMLLSAILSVLNNFTLANILTALFEDWISGRTAENIILQSFLKIIGNAISNSDAAGALMECALQSFFTASVSQSEAPTWRNVLKYFDPGCPKQPTLEQPLVANGRILTLHAIMLKKTKDMGQANETVLLDMLMDWLTNIKVTEAVETKIPLLWIQVLSLAYTPSCQHPAKTAGFLKRFVNYLLTISESKGSGWGRNLLGAIGIGKQDTISSNCRFLSKALAGYVLAQLPGPKNGEQTVRTCAGAPGPVGQPGGNTDCAKVLLKLDMRIAELKPCTELAIKQIQDPNNSMHNAANFAVELLQQLYCTAYLKNFVL